MARSLRLSRLAIELDRSVPPIPGPRRELEQYTTPGDLAARLAWAALEILGPGEWRFADLAAGTCRISAALALVGMGPGVAVEADPRLAPLCLEGLSRLGLLGAVSPVVSWIARDRGPLARGAFELVASNPPFGVWRRGADTEVILYGLRLRPRLLLAILKHGNLDYWARVAGSEGYRVRLLLTYPFPIPASMRRHRSRIRRVEVDLVGFEPA